VEDVARYYADPHVRARIREYFGAPAEGGTASAAYLASLDPRLPRPIMWQDANRSPVSDLEAAWKGDADVARSLLDHEHLVFMFELDYLNPDRPAEPFTHPTEVLHKLEPAYQASRSVLEAFGLWPYTLVTGRGYHFTGRIPLIKPVVDALAVLVPGTPSWVETVEMRRQGGPKYEVAPRVAQAWTGLGCLVEHVAHLVLGSGKASPIPLVFNGTPVGTGQAVRECVSLDFSYVGDPLDARYVRSAFSAYQWHRFRPDIFGKGTAVEVPPLAAVPRGHQSLPGLLRSGRSLEAGRRAARHGPATIPDVTVGVERLLAHYRASPLAAFHRRFYEERRAAVPASVRTPQGLPPCAAAILAQPNDLLLKPECIQHLVRILLARGWSAGQVVALVQASYEVDHAWGDRWCVRMDSRTRAEFDVRVFGGLVVTGDDRLLDFNCVSAQEKGICPRDVCQFDLRIDRDRLMRQPR